MIERIGQTVLTCPTTACFDGLPDSPDRLAIGKPLRTFGDGFQASKVIGGQRYWRVPVMEGEFLIQENVRQGEGRWRRQLPDSRRERRCGAKCGGGGGRRNGGNARRDPPVSRRYRAQR